MEEPNPEEMTPFGPNLLFDDISFADSAFELFLTTGQPGGTVQLTNGTTNPGFNGAFPPFAVLGNRMLFAGANLSDLFSLWATDGTVAGTQQLASSSSPYGLLPGYILPVGQHAFFTGYDASSLNQLWVTNGTAAGTVQLTTGGAASATLSEPLVAFGSKVLFVADQFDLWISDGTGGGTKKLTSAPGSVEPITTITVLPR